MSSINSLIGSLIWHHLYRREYYLSSLAILEGNERCLLIMIFFDRFLDYNDIFDIHPGTFSDLKFLNRL